MSPHALHPRIVRFSSFHVFQRNANRTAVHTQNQSQAAGTAFAISYEVGTLVSVSFPSLIPLWQSDINNVTPDNLAVFSVRYKCVLAHVRKSARPD